MQSQILNLLSVLNCCLYRDRSFINIVNSFTNKPTFFNIVPQLIKKTYRAGTTWFYRFACAITSHAHIYLMTRLADWDGLRNHFRDIPWEDIFKVSASAAASEFCEWVKFGIDVSITHCKYHVMPLSSPCFSAACAATIVHKNHFFRLYQKNKSLNLK